MIRLSLDTALLSDSLGTQENVQSVKDQGSTLIVQVNDPNLVDSVDVFKSLGIGVKDVKLLIRLSLLHFQRWPILHDKSWRKRLHDIIG